MADTTVNIKLNTTANTSGADATTAAVKKVEQATKAVNAAEAQRSASAASAAASLNALHGAQVRAAGSSRNLGAQTFIAANMFQDYMAAGLRGVTNQVGQFGTAIGLGAGLSGGLMALGVLVEQLGPKIAGFFAGLDTNKIKREGIDALIKQLGEVVAPMTAAERSAAKFNAQTDLNNEALKRLNETLDNHVKLLALQAAAQRSAAEFETEQAVQDVQAQGLDPAAEAAAIARLKQRGLERQKQIADEEAIAKLGAATAQRDAATNAASAAEARAAAEEQRLRNTARLNDLLQQQKTLEDDLNSARQVAAMSATGTGLVDPAAKRRVEELQGAVAANAEAQKNIGPTGNLAALSESAPAARAEAAKQRAAAEQAARSAAQLSAEEALKAQERGQSLTRETQRLNRSLAPGVYDPRNLQAPGSPFGPAPLPGPAAFAPGQLPPNPFGVPQPLPAASNAAPPPGLGQPAPLPGNDQLVKATQAAAASNAQANEAMLAALKKLETDNKKLTEQLKNSRA